MKFIKTFENYQKFKPHKVNDLLKHINHFTMTVFNKFDSLVIQMQELSKKIKIEAQKPYSEEKYEMQDELQKLFRTYWKGYNEGMTEMVLQYYKKYGSDMTSDVDNAIKWLSGENPYETDNRIIFLKSVQKALKRSGIEKDWNDLKNI